MENLISMNDLVNIFIEGFLPLRLLTLKIVLLTFYKPDNVHRWSWFTKNPWNKYGSQYCLFKKGKK